MKLNATALCVLPRRANRRTIALLVTLVAMASACAHSKPVKMPTAGTLQFFEAAPSEGFNYPYLIRFPDSQKAVPSVLLVEPNNTGRISDDLADHRKAAEDLAQRAIGQYVARKLNLVLLVPVFPRPKSEWQIYTHALDRDSMLIQDGPMKRLDLQLLAMVKDARKRLRAYGLDMEAKVLITGFSASGTFGNRFTLLHPTAVKAVSSGGVNGILILPVKAIGGRSLAYPLGVSDLKQIAATTFDESAWRRVPQFIYMGRNDDNDAVAFDDGYSEEERAIVHSVIGKQMQPDRWEKCQQAYRQSGANVTFHTYDGIGHATNGPINGDIVEFFRSVIEGQR